MMMLALKILVTAKAVVLTQTLIVVITMLAPLTPVIKRLDVRMKNIHVMIPVNVQLIAVILKLDAVFMK
jgi:hypothetical protein